MVKSIVGNAKSGTACAYTKLATSTVTVGNLQGIVDTSGMVCQSLTVKFGVVGEF